MKRAPFGESEWEQVWADMGVNLLSVSHWQQLGLQRRYQCECGWRGRTASQRDQHRKSSKRHAEWAVQA